MAKFTKEMIIGDVVKEHPELIDTFVENGMHCIGCPSAQMEAISDACMVHGLDADKLLTALNKTQE
jgi:hybrid cluster-associated redox disulfide protein